MKIIGWIFPVVMIMLIGCSKKNKNISNTDDVYVEKPYDTIAIDSFSSGAISVNVAERIRMSSQKYRDSVKRVLLKQEEERRQKEEKDRLEKAAKEALEKEQKKAEEQKKMQSASENNPQ